MPWKATNGNAIAEPLAAADTTNATSSRFRRNYSVNICPISTRGLPTYTPGAFDDCLRNRGKFWVPTRLPARTDEWAHRMGYFRLTVAFSGSLSLEPPTMMV